uniref:Hypothetical chloroplast RF40 n=1 Tax=Nanofrustulum shiloi TaxID=210602 RepID=A0A650G2V0_9STRA|nr:hypothetical chloroplast RF40 [Nanofrustulum shiloi]
MSIKKQFFVNGHEFSTNITITLSDLLYYFNYTKSLFVLEYNNSICEKTQWNKIFIEDNDKIEIVTIVGGG